MRMFIGGFITGVYTIFWFLVGSFSGLVLGKLAFDTKDYTSRKKPISYTSYYRRKELDE